MHTPLSCTAPHSTTGHTPPPSPALGNSDGTYIGYPGGTEGGREGGRERGREGERERGRERGREGERERGRERERQRERVRERERERERESEYAKHRMLLFCSYFSLAIVLLYLANSLRCRLLAAAANFAAAANRGHHNKLARYSKVFIAI